MCKKQEITRTININYPFPNNVRNFYVEWWLDETLKTPLGKELFSSSDLIRFINKRLKKHFP